MFWRIFTIVSVAIGLIVIGNSDECRDFFWENIIPVAGVSFFILMGIFYLLWRMIRED